MTEAFGPIDFPTGEQNRNHRHEKAYLIKDKTKVAIGLILDNLSHTPNHFPSMAKSHGRWLYVRTNGAIHRHHSLDEAKNDAIKDGARRFKKVEFTPDLLTDTIHDGVTLLMTAAEKARTLHD